MSSTAPPVPSAGLAAWVRRLERAGDAAQGAILRSIVRLPEPVQRRLVGAPVVRDGQTLATEIQLMLRLQELLGMEGLPADDIGGARPRRELVRQAQIVSGNPDVGLTQDLAVDGAVGSIPARLYVPRARLRASAVPGGLAPVAGTKDPLLIWYHGGGMVRGDLDSHDAVCRVLAEEADCRVLSVAYRLAPEHPFPAQIDDAEAAYRWVVRNAEILGADPDRLAVAGDSAGANLATITAITAAREGLPLAFQVLAYPVTDWDGSLPSRQLFAEGFVLTQPFMDAASDAYVAGADLADWRLDLPSVDLPAGLAPAYVCTAGFDPLRDEGEAYVAQLAAAGVEVEHDRFEGLVHAFVHFLPSRTSRAALSTIASQVRRGLS